MSWNYEVDNVDIMNSFNIAKIATLLDEQLGNGSNDRSSEYLSDLFLPFYKKYKELMDNGIQDEDIAFDITNKFTQICKIFQERVSRKFGMDVMDDAWVNESLKNNIATTMCMYHFFVLDLQKNIECVIYNFIKRNKDMLNRTFEGYKTKKDAATLLNKKNMDEDIVVIVSNLFAVSSYIISILDEEIFLDYVDITNEDCKLIVGLYQKGYIGGSFMNTIKEIFTKNMGMNTDICLDIISKLKGEN